MVNYGMLLLLLRRFSHVRLCATPLIPGFSVHHPLNEHEFEQAPLDSGRIENSEVAPHEV